MLSKREREWFNTVIPRFRNTAPTPSNLREMYGFKSVETQVLIRITK